jgi:hypothetical protein
MMTYVLVVIVYVFGNGLHEITNFKQEMPNQAVCNLNSSIIVDDMKKKPINPDVNVKTYCLPIQ